MPVKPEFVINLKGKQFVLLAGLLDLAHQQGLRSIETEIMGEFCDRAERSYVVRAIGRFRTGDGEDAVWSACGDAAPGNTQMKGAELRHAESRAIARMLRFATNVAMTAFEELPPDAEAHNGPQTNHSARTGQQRARRDPEDEAAHDDPNDPACEWPECPRRVSTDQERRSREHFDKVLCSNHEAQLAVVRSKKATKPVPVTTETDL